MRARLGCVVHSRPAMRKDTMGLDHIIVKLFEGRNNARSSCVREHDVGRLGGRDHTGQATPLVPLLSAYPLSAAGSIVGGGKIESDHFHSPLSNISSR